MDSMHRQNELDVFAEITSKLDQEIRHMKKDNARMVKSEGNLVPTIATKVAINHDGLVTQTFKLTSDDIPSIPISKVEGLSETIEELRETTITKTIINEVPAITEFKMPVLTEEDLPDIPMEKIKGLTEALILIETSPCRAPEPATPLNLPPIEVIKYKDITMDALPRELINQVNAIDTSLKSLASKESVDSLRSDVQGKVDANDPIEDGTYAIVKVDRKGLVIGGREITMGDLPPSLNDDIYEIKRSLPAKAEHTEVVELMNQLNSFIHSMIQLDLGNLKNSIGNKCTKEELHHVETLVENLAQKIAVPSPPAPDDALMAEIQQLKSQISSLEGTVTNLQQKLTSLSLEVSAKADN